MAALERVIKVALGFLPEAFVVAVVLQPHVAPLARLLIAVAALVFFADMVRHLGELRGIVKMKRARLARTTHGFEHAAIAVLEERGIPVRHGFTFGDDHFVVAMPQDCGFRLESVREAALAAIFRIRGGEAQLAYTPECGTATPIRPIILWLGFFLPLVVAALLGGDGVVCIALLVIISRVLFAFGDSVILRAEEVFTVSTDFASAAVMEVREVREAARMTAPDHETWFEVLVDIRLG